MNAATRRRALGLAVRQRGSVPVTELAAELGYSEMTIRRDLNVLERDGVIRRGLPRPTNTDRTRELFTSQLAE